MGDVRKENQCVTHEFMLKYDGIINFECNLI